MANISGPILLTPLSRATHERAALRRLEEGILEHGEDVRYVITRAGTVCLSESADGAIRLVLETEDPRGAARTPAVLLGEEDGLRLIGVEIPEASPELDGPARDMRELRRVVQRMGERECAIALTASAMASWHRSMRHCPLCGSLLEPRAAGWVLQCPQDGSEHFPRTDAAVIMAVRDQQDRLLLARNAHFPSAFHSVLAGFVEPGESIEDAVVREVAEESSLRVTELEYAGSQPWPFPRSLMLAFRARADSRDPIVLADGELAEARWFSRAQLREALADGTVEVPTAASIGRALIEDWYGQPLLAP